jgi:hypothetical protein
VPTFIRFQAPGTFEGSMRFKRYLAVMGASSVTAAVLVAGFNLLVDPLGISPIRIAIAGFNEWKPLREDYDRIVKPYDVRRTHPKTIFIGSSRIKQTIDPKLLAGTEFAPAYNAGINGSADYEELNSYLQYYISADKQLRHVFIEAFASAMFSVEPRSRRGTPLKPMMQLGLKEYVADFGSVFFSVNGLNSSIRSAWLNRRSGRDHWVLPAGGSGEDGFAPVALSTTHFSVRNVFNFVLHKTVFRSNRLDPRFAVAAEAMIADCRKHGVECRFFLSPLHADVLYALYHLNLWPEVEKLKRTLAALAPTYDFTRYNDLIDERTGPVVYWPEAFHFAPALGKLMTEAMTGVRTANMPENFGVMLDPSNIDASLAAWRAERDSWIARHPGAVQRMQKAQANFQDGVSFEAVTDAELKAGGW